MGTTKQRLERLKTIPEIINNNGGQITVGELYGQLALEWGITRKTFWDYMEALRAAKKITYPLTWLTQNEDHVILKTLN